MPWQHVFDVVGENGVEIAHTVGAGKGEIAAVILVDQRYGLVREPVFALPIAEIVGQGAPEPHAHFRAGLLMESCERGID